MKTRALVLALSAAAALFAAPVAQACSVIDTYRVPTNLELVAGAPLIMLGEVTGQVKTGSDPWDIALTVKPVAAVRGTLPDGPIQLAENSLAQGNLAGYGVLSNPYEFEGAHPVSYIGSCIRRIFPKGTTALFFLEQRDGEWVSAGGPFTRWAEDVMTRDAPWLRLVRFYARVADAPEADRPAMLVAERDRYAAMTGDPVAQLMAADIARQLEGPNETWNAVMSGGIDMEDSGPLADDFEAGDVEVTVGEDGYSLEGSLDLQKADPIED